MSAGDTLDMGTNSLTVMSAVRYATVIDTGVIIAKTRYAGGAGRWVLYRAQSGGGLGSGTQYDTVLQPDFVPCAILQVANSSTSARINGFVLNRSTSGSCKIWNNGTNTASATFTGNTTDFNNTDQLWLGAYQNPGGTTPPTGGGYLNGVTHFPALRSGPLALSGPPAESKLLAAAVSAGKTFVVSYTCNTSYPATTI